VAGNSARSATGYCNLSKTLLVAMTESWRLKIERAEKHLGELRVEIDRYTQTHPFETVRVRGGPRCNQHRDCLRYRLRVTSQPGPGLAIIAGDVLHNARSALDHLAVALVPPARRRSAGFPIELDDIWARKQRKYVVRDSERRRRFNSAINGMPKPAVRIIKAVQPYRRGGKGTAHVLYLLSKLENADKHRELIPFAAGLNDTVATATARGQAIALPMPDLPEAPTFVADGHVVAHFGYRSAPGMPPLRESEVNVEVRGTPRVAIQIAERDPKTGALPEFMPLLNLLETLLRQIRDEIFPALEPHIHA
jgi:hypothetical protein